MAVTVVTAKMAAGVNYTHTTDTSGDWPSVPNDTYFYDLASELPYYKNGSGTVIAIYESASLSLNDLTDVDLTTPPTDDQVLQYDALSGTWKAGTVSLATPSLQQVTDVGSITTNTITAGKLESDTIQVTGGAGTQGTMTWNPNEATIELVNNGSTTLIAQEFHYHVRNNTGVQIDKGTVVGATGTLGASGKITVGPFLADGATDSHYVIGLAQTDIPNGSDGKIHGKGKIIDLDTTGTLVGEVWNDGDVLYISATVPGALTKVKPDAPNQRIPIAFVIYAHANNGVLQVRTLPDEPLSSNEEVQITAVQNGDILEYNSATQRWENKPISFSNTSFAATYNSWVLDAGDIYYADVPHNLATNDVFVAIYDAATFEEVLVEKIDRIDVNTVRVFVQWTNPPDPAPNLRVMVTTGGVGTVDIQDLTVTDPATPYTPSNREVVIWDCTAGNKVLDLPDAAANPNMKFHIKKTDASTNTITVTPAGANTIDGGATAVINSQWQSLTIISNGTNWFII